MRPGVELQLGDRWTFPVSRFGPGLPSPLCSYVRSITWLTFYPRLGCARRVTPLATPPKRLKGWTTCSCLCQSDLARVPLRTCVSQMCSPANFEEREWTDCAQKVKWNVLLPLLVAWYKTSFIAHVCASVALRLQLNSRAKWITPLPKFGEYYLQNIHPCVLLLWAKHHKTQAIKLGIRNCQLVRVISALCDIIQG